MKKKENMPLWAYWGLWGIHSRKVALGFVVVTGVVSLLCIAVGIMVHAYTLLSFPLVPLWYWLSLKWADNNSAWDATEDS